MPQKAKDGAAYCRLDDAITTLKDWHKEIADELARRGITWKALDAVLRAAEAVHGPEEE